jgi:hypothetical protein
MAQTKYQSVHSAKLPSKVARGVILAGYVLAFGSFQLFPFYAIASQRLLLKAHKRGFSPVQRV